jgi:FlaA1/EpsC-like NDP-sugar epimerase
MDERQIKLPLKPFLIFCIGIFALSVGPMYFFVRPEKQVAEKIKLDWTIAITISLVLAVAFSFIICGIYQTIKKFQSGELDKADLVIPASGGIWLIVFLTLYLLFPRIAGSIEITIWAIGFILWIIDAIHRFLNRQKRSNSTFRQDILK